MRKSNFELLRIVSMIMVVILHVLGKTGALQYSNEGVNFYIAHFLESFSIIAVTLFVLITGYFSTSIKEIPLKKLKMLWQQIMFYAVGITLIFLVFDFSLLSVNVLIKTVLPILSMNWWFISAYIVLMFLAPYINRLVNNLSEKEFTILVVILIFIGFIWTTVSIIPGIEPIIKDRGYGIATVVIWYILGVYIRQYSHKIKINKYWYLLGYISFSLIIFLSITLSNLVVGKPIQFLYGYNNIFVLGSAVSLFLFFEQINIKSEIINKVATLTLGVYLIHEQVLVRQTLYTSMEWDFGNMNAVEFLVFVFGFTALIFILCSIIEKIRQITFGKVSQLFPKSKQGIFKTIES